MNVEILGRIETSGITHSDRRALSVRCEAAQRTLFGFSHTWIADLVAGHGLDGIDGSTPLALATLIRMSLARAGQRIRYAEQFGERSSMTGERMVPLRTESAAAIGDGVPDEEHQSIIRKFFRKLGTKVDKETRENAEKQLAQLARDLGPDHYHHPNEYICPSDVPLSDFGGPDSASGLHASNSSRPRTSPPAEDRPKWGVDSSGACPEPGAPPA